MKNFEVGHEEPEGCKLPSLAENVCMQLIENANNDLLDRFLEAKIKHGSPLQKVKHLMNK